MKCGGSVGRDDLAEAFKNIWEITAVLGVLNLS